MNKMRSSAILIAAMGILAMNNVNAEDRGAEIFNGMCNRCHGSQGQGVKGLEAPLIAGMPAWYVESQLKKFRQDLRGTHPKDMPGMRMRPMANTLRESDIALVAKYVEKIPTQPAMQIDSGDPKKGEASFATCAGCHGADGKGNEAMSAPNLVMQDGWYLVSQLKNFKDGIRGADPRDSSGSMMRPMVATLTTEESMKDVVAYIQSLSKK